MLTQRFCSSDVSVLFFCVVVLCFRTDWNLMLQLVAIDGKEDNRDLETNENDTDE